jgi:CDP-paratose 2-epimerase
VVFRMSCLYGPRQFGTEDQGWVAHFLIRALQGQPITIFGDGKQVRDLLYVDDALDAYVHARSRIDALAGQAFNLGGGPDNTASLLELLAGFAELGIGPTPLEFAEWRPGDQRYYVSDTSKFEGLTGWRARTSVAEGLRRLHRWLLAHGLDTTDTVPLVKRAVEFEKVPA